MKIVVKFFIQLILELLLLVVSFFSVFVLKTPDIKMYFLILFAFLVLLFTIVKWKRPVKDRNFHTVILIVTSLCLLIMTFIYMTGLIKGFQISYSAIYKKYISTETWIMTFFIVIATEVIRYVLSLVRTNREKKYWILYLAMLINFVLIDLIISTRVTSYYNFGQFYEFFFIVAVQSLAKNIFLMYLSGRFGIIPCLSYRVIMDLYIYFLPVVPKINIFIQAVLLVIFPYILYLVIKKYTAKRKIEPIRKNKVFNRIVTVILSMSLLTLIMLVSREFKYSMIAVGSKSMTGSINKGDAVIYEKYISKEMKLKNGDIIVFSKNDMIVVHRIVEVFELDEGEFVYRTKGDANTSDDNWLVSEKEIFGRVNIRVLWIAWPSVLLNELF